MVAIIHFDGENRRRTITRGRLLTPSYPTAATTGLAGVGLTVEDLTPSGSVTTSENGEVIELLDISGGIDVNHNNVTIRKCFIESDSWGVIRLNGTSNPSGLTVEDCLIVGQMGGSGWPGGAYGIALRDGPGHLIQRNDISQCGDMTSGGSSDTSWLDNYYHNPFSDGGEPHYDGIEILWGDDLLIQHNTIDMTTVGQTSTVNITGTVNRCTTNNNRLLGGGYTITVDGLQGTFTDIVFTNNRFEMGAFDYALVRDFPASEWSWSGNVDDITGDVIPDPGVS